MADLRDITALPDLSSTSGRVGPVRSRMPVYMDFLPPCNNACPAGENIQEYLRLVKAGQEHEAWLEIVKNNPFPAIHGRVCYHPCESACNRGCLDQSISIHGVERYLGDMALDKGWAYPEPETKSGMRVLVVGSGPAGLSCAYHLARLGHEVEIRDAGELPGGMMRYGIPEYRLPRDVLDAEIARLEALGVVITQNHVVKDLLQEQAEGRFDAVFTGIGAGLSKNVDIPSMDASRMIDAVSLLHDVAAGDRPLIGKKVAVYGGGNTAMDAARVARRLGAEEAIVIYRRTGEQMPALPAEREEAEAEGVKMHWLRTISEVESDGDVQVEIMELDEKGRAVGTGRFETLQADTVVLAIGQETDSNFLRQIPGMKFDGDLVKVDPFTLMTEIPGIFAGGDAIRSDKTVTIAVGHGKKAARMIDAWMHNRVASPKRKHPLVTFDQLHLWYFGDHERPVQSELDLTNRADFEEIVRGLEPAEAKFEAIRCLSCGNCIECDGCLGACPEDAVIKLGKGYRYRYNYEKCTGCATCYEQCPVHAIEMIPEH
ncbi:MAG: NAD(P)-binding protein [Propionibacteriaceae bacterium]|jgi:NADPH-dependent glutamate synthase beta subunit-like oxidoreductase|nr:NAD(P)-binding protein [Propionibacteriaceae bacterium]